MKLNDIEMAAFDWEQAVSRACKEASEGAEVEVLPVDLCGPFSQLHEASVRADDAFEGAGVDYLVHNAGRSASPSSLEIFDDLCQVCC